MEWRRWIMFWKKIQRHPIVDTNFSWMKVMIDKNNNTYNTITRIPVECGGDWLHHHLLFSFPCSFHIKRRLPWRSIQSQDNVGSNISARTCSWIYNQVTRCSLRCQQSMSEHMWYMRFRCWYYRNVQIRTQWHENCQG